MNQAKDRPEVAQFVVIGCRVNKETHELAIKLAMEEEVGVSVIMRRALKEYLKKAL